MSDLQFTFEEAKELFDSEDQFPVDFEKFWVWCGYAKKQNAKDKLTKNFKLDFDYRVTHLRESAPSGGLTHREDIKLTFECAKQLAMMAGTEKGSQVRQYFLDCERQLKEFARQHREMFQAVSLTNQLVQDFKQLKALSSVYAANFLSEIGVEKPLVTSEDDLNSSLVANRLGLAFNKHLKTFETLRDATSPEAFTMLKEQYLTLAEEHTKLLRTKTPKPVVEYITEYVTDTKQIEELQSKSILLNEALSVAAKEMRFYRHEVENLEQEITRLTKKPNKPMLPGS